MLKKIQSEDPDLEIEEIEVTKHPLKALRHGIKMIPALTRGDKKLSGIFLSEEIIREYLNNL